MNPQVVLHFSYPSTNSSLVPFFLPSPHLILPFLPPPIYNYVFPVPRERLPYPLIHYALCISVVIRILVCLLKT